MYEITITNAGDLMWRGAATINGTPVGPVRIACETQEEAEQYIEKTFLPDLRRNYPRQFGTLVFPWEVVEPEGGEE